MLNSHHRTSPIRTFLLPVVVLVVLAAVRIGGSDPVHIKVNCGVNNYDVTGWDRDDGYVTGGADWPNPDSLLISTAGVANAAPIDVYKSVRHRNPHVYN
ncbi:MAG: hypothetical protein GF418_14315, partial [Chitinivibrionales bacterium]|nr:hypothetical protein [Chitinivibrionales bacterium]MBD3396794.1 hypothetical protein [Chitinivibrionales bacterium]